MKPSSVNLMSRRAARPENWPLTWGNVGYVSLAVRGSRVKRADLPAFWVAWAGSGPGELSPGRGLRARGDGGPAFGPAISQG